MDFSKITKIVIPEGEVHKIKIKNGSTLWTINGICIQNNTKDVQPPVSIQESLASLTISANDDDTITNTTATPYGQYEYFGLIRAFKTPTISVSKGQCDWLMSE